ncbi:hypothetical protein [Haloferula sp. BvORR071]|uniref:hypothetical protein n=1 Tax=Haloferula sp. BvORR071 TaxID=1396141 RepID=UPI0005544A58|nr:hypothetical protein [Haloferula sp. BvORR071]
MSSPVPSQAKTLQRLYLALFLRGRGARGLRKDQAPRSIAQKLWGTIALYVMVGMMALTFVGQGSFLLSFYLHGSTLLFLGMFIATSAGEILFNKDEAEILLHRPIEPRTLLWAKVTVLMRVSLWIACAFNLAGAIAGSVTAKGAPFFAPVHFVSICISALFCAGSVVLLYQLCLRWFGRERLDNLMTTAQVLLAVVIVVASQMVPHLVLGMKGRMDPLVGKPWLSLLPPAWFASLDEVLLGRGNTTHFMMAGIGVLVTATVLILAFGRMARAYEEGLQTLAESRPRAPHKESQPGKRRLLDRLTSAPPLVWLLRDPVTRASFRLCAAYLLRDRDMKLRLYPGMAPMLVMPAMFMFQGMKDHSGAPWGVALAAGYLGMIPMMAMTMLQFSQHWQAADLYRLAPVTGPGPFIHGAIRAVTILLALPAMLLLVSVTCLFPNGFEKLLLILPGVIAMPFFAMVPGALEKCVPLAKPTEEAKSASRGGMIFLLMIVSMIVPALATGAQMVNLLPHFLLLETSVVIAACWLLKLLIDRKQWDPLE